VGLTACAPTKVEGVWHFYLSLPEGSDCTQDLLHNFNDVVTEPDIEDTGSPWTEESSNTASDSRGARTDSSRARPEKLRPTAGVGSGAGFSAAAALTGCSSASRRGSMGGV
jgi:hypothetical protein